MSLVVNAKPGSVELGVDFDLSVKLIPLDSTEGVIEAKIHRVSAGLIELWSPIFLKLEQKVAVDCDGRSFLSRVAYCRSHYGGIYTVAIRTAPDLYVRSAHRIPVDLSTKLSVVGSPTSIPVRVVDLSPSGVGMELKVPVPVGARASVHLGYRLVLGEIRHCAPKLDRYRAGLLLENVVRCDDTSGSLWTNLNNGAENRAALEAFLCAIDVRQSRSLAVVSSLCLLNSTK